MFRLFFLKNIFYNRNHVRSHVKPDDQVIPSFAMFYLSFWINFFFIWNEKNDTNFRTNSLFFFFFHTWNVRVEITYIFLPSKKRKKICKDHRWPRKISLTYYQSVLFFIKSQLLKILISLELIFHPLIRIYTSYNIYIYRIIRVSINQVIWYSKFVLE